MKILIIVFISAFITFAQSEYLPDKYFGGIRTEGAFFFNMNATNYGMGIGLSLLNRIDLGYEHVSTSYESTYDLRSSSSLFYIGYNVKGENIVLKLLVGYTSISTDMVIPPFKINLNITGPIFGVIFYPKILESESVIVMPGIGLSFGMLTIEDKTSYSDYGDVESPRSLSLELNIISRANKTIFINISPFVSKDLNNSDNGLFLGINLGLSFNFLNPD